MSKATFRCRCHPAAPAALVDRSARVAAIQCPIKVNQTMKLPQREFYTLHEVAARWGCALADISGWSTVTARLAPPCQRSWNIGCAN